jgi:hypothetical protein
VRHRGLACRRGRDRCSIFLGHHHGENRLAVVTGAAHGLEAHQRRGSVAVVVADVDAEAQLAGVAVAPAQRKASIRTPSRRASARV